MKRCGNGVCAFGQTYANELRRRRPRCGDKWHLDEVFLTIRGERHYLWRAVDQDGNVLDILVQSRRNKHAAKRFFRKLLKGLQYVPRVIIADKLKSYAAAKRAHFARSRASAAQRAEQPGRELAPTHTTPREEDETFQIGQTGTTFSLCVWSHFRAFPTPSSPFEGRGIPCSFTGSLSGVERGNQGKASSIIPIRHPVASYSPVFSHFHSTIHFAPLNK